MSEAPREEERANGQKISAGIQELGIRLNLGVVNSLLSRGDLPAICRREERNRRAVSNHRCRAPGRMWPTLRRSGSTGPGSAGPGSAGPGSTGAKSTTCG